MSEQAKDQGQEGTENTATNYLEMSDEEIMNMTPPTDVAPPAKPEDEQQEEEVDPDTKAEGQGADEDDDGNQENTDDDTKDEDREADPDAAAAKSGTDEQAEDEGGDDKDKAKDEKATSKEEQAKAKDPKAGTDVANGNIAKDGKDESKEDKSDGEGEGEAEPVNYEDVGKRILAPFKANGKDIQVKSVDDAIQLMQMGANYNKKMAALKPNLKLMKLLQNNGLLSEEKIGFLIDLTNKNVGAINKLVQESGVDPMDLNADKASEYKQSTYTVDDREIALDTVLDEIKESKKYTQTLDVVGNKWDDASKRIVADQPELIRVINGHMESGVYDLIAAEIDNERMLGRLKGVTDIEAYRQVGDALAKRGAFQRLLQGSSQEETKTPEREEPVVPRKPVKQVDAAALKDKRRAASSTKPSTPSKQKPADFNPLAMSDAEFEKQAQAKFL